jgi:hypothetical protein
MSEAGSGIEGLRADSAFARFAAAALAEPFKLVDVGCAGGLAAGWRVFGDRLHALAYDPDAAEIARLSAAESNLNVGYVRGLVGPPSDHPLAVRMRDRLHQHAWVGGRLAYERVRAMKAREAAGLPPETVDDYFRRIAAPADAAPRGGFDLDYAAAFEAAPYAGVSDGGDPPMIYLPGHLAQADFLDVDVLKIDVDGPDFDVLRSCAGLLDRPSLLAVSIEVSFFGSHDANDNTFHNVDRLMRQKGFDLFGLSVRGYASAALPSPFLDRHASANYQGRPYQGDALYVRDLASPALRDLAAALSVGKLLKAAALFALFGLQDQAAELLLVHRERLEAVLDVESGLDLLTHEIPDYDPGVGYREWIAAFERADPQLYDVYGRREAWLAGLMAAARDAPAQAAALEAAQGRANEAEAARRNAEAERDALRAELEAVRRSPLWRAAARLGGHGGRPQGAA